MSTWIHFQFSLLVTYTCSIDIMGFYQFLCQMWPEMEIFVCLFSNDKFKERTWQQWLQFAILSYRQIRHSKRLPRLHLHRLVLWGKQYVLKSQWIWHAIPPSPTCGVSCQICRHSEDGRIQPTDNNIDIRYRYCIILPLFTDYNFH